MRLSPYEIEIIKETIQNIDPEAAIYVFGSRLDDKARGGDIDLLVIAEEFTFRKKQKARLEICSKLGDQKIDILASSLGTIDQNPFISIAYKKGVKL